MAQPDHGDDQQWGLLDVLPAFPHDHVIAATVPERMKCPITLEVMAGEAAGRDQGEESGVLL